MQALTIQALAHHLPLLVWLAVLEHTLHLEPLFVQHHVQQVGIIQAQALLASFAVQVNIRYLELLLVQTALLARTIQTRVLLHLQLVFHALLVHTLLQLQVVVLNAAQEHTALQQVQQHLLLLFVWHVVQENILRQLELQLAATVHLIQAH